MNWIAIWVTFKLAAPHGLALLVVGLPIAYWLTFSSGAGSLLVESVVALPLVLPPTVLGFYILVAIGPHSPFGRFYTDVVGQPLPLLSKACSWPRFCIACHSPSSHLRLPLSRSIGN